MSEEYKIVEGRIYKRWKSEITKPRLKGKLSFEESIQMLINRCMTCPEEEFPQNVNRLFWSVPQSWRDEELLEAMEEAIQIVEYSTPVLNCGIPINPDVLPGRVETIREVDWNALFHAILNCYPKERIEVVTERV